MVAATLTGIADPAKVKRSICAMGHKWMWNPKWGGLPPQSFLSKVDPLFDGIRDKTRRPVAERNADHIARLQRRQVYRRTLRAFPIGDRYGGGYLQVDDTERETHAGRDLERAGTRVHRANCAPHAVVRGGGLLCDEQNGNDD